MHSLVTPLFSWLQETFWLFSVSTFSATVQSSLAWTVPLQLYLELLSIPLPMFWTCLKDYLIS